MIRAKLVHGCCLAAMLLGFVPSAVAQLRPSFYPLAFAKPTGGDCPVPLPQPTGNNCVQDVQVCDPDLYCSSPSAACLLRSFPETTWRICVEDKGMKGLWIGPVELARPGDAFFTRVIYQAGLAEIFVPYHDGGNRPYDLRNCTSHCLAPVSPDDVGSQGFTLTLPGGAKPELGVECRETGIAWLCKQDSNHSRRGQELVVWGIQDAGNYDNIIEYTFHDDGRITFRTGHTGYNDPARPLSAHMHDSVWRVDIDLNGPTGDSAYLVRHVEGTPSSLDATDYEDEFNVDGRAGGWPVDVKEFHTLLIEDATTNLYGNHYGYEFTHIQNGQSRHDESWTEGDFFVSTFDANGQGWMTTWAPPQTYLPPVFTSGPSVMNTDVVAWVHVAGHHEPHDEDRFPGDPANDVTGVTLVHWTGFEMTPHDLFNFNPLGAPKRCGN